MSEKKVVSRNFAIVLGIIAIILLVGLVGAIANYTSIINAKDNTIADKDSQISSLHACMTNKNGHRFCRSHLLFAWCQL